MNDLDQLFEKLSRSKFRSSFKLKPKDIAYIDQKSFSTIVEHAEDFIEKRLKPAFPKNDGKQTPYGKHPVFIAQHATGTCCRSCLEKWHGISKGIELNDTQKSYVVKVISGWIESQLKISS